MVIIPWAIIIPVVLAITVIGCSRLWKGRVVLIIAGLGLVGLAYMQGVANFSFPTPARMTTRHINGIELTCLLMTVFGLVGYGHTRFGQR